MNLIWFITWSILYYCHNSFVIILSTLERIWKLKKVVSFWQKPNGSNVNESKKRWDKLIITSGNSAKSFNFIEKTLNKMTFLIQPMITIPRVRIVFFWQNDVFCISLGSVSSDFFQYHRLYHREYYCRICQFPIKHLLLWNREPDLL